MSVPTKIRFDTFELDVAAGQLRKSGILLKLQPQPFRLLLLLLERAGQVVTREEIQSALWTNSTFVDFEHGINFSINQIRGALADSAEKPRYVETLPKRGYRFVGVVEKCSIAIHPATVGDVPDAQDQSAKEALAYPLPPRVENAEFPSRGASRERSLHWKLVLFTGAVVVGLSCVGLGIPLWKSHKASANPGNMHIVRLTESGNAVDVAISPNGDYVAYVLCEGEKCGLRVRQVLTGSEVQILPPAEVGLNGLTFSPDGNYIFFLRTPEENFSVDYLYQMPVLGGTPRKLIRDVNTPVSFSPDGKQFAFLRIKPSGTHLMIANVDGSGERMLTSHPGFYPEHPAWSPDGGTIAFPGPGPSGEGAALWAASVMDGSMHSIYKTPYGIGRVEWLQDGSGLIAVMGGSLGPDPQGQGQLWYISYPGGDAKRVTNDLSNYSSGTLDLSRDGKSLVAIEDTINSDLWVASGDDFGQAKPITSGRNAILSVSAGPERTIVFASQKGDLYSIHGDGKGLTLLSPDIHNNGHPSVCQDTGYIVFDSMQNIWRMDADGSHVTQLTTSGSSAVAPLCSPDSQSVQYFDFPDSWRVPIGGGTPMHVNINNLIAVPAAYSPDGKFVAYEDFGPGGDAPHRISVIPEAGGEPIYSFPMREDALSQPIRWTTNGAGLDFILTNNGVDNIWRQTIPRGIPRQITNFTSGLIFSFDWSSDGKELYVARGSILTDVVLITNFRSAP